MTALYRNISIIQLNSWHTFLVVFPVYKGETGSSSKYIAGWFGFVYLPIADPAFRQNWRHCRHWYHTKTTLLKETATWRKPELQLPYHSQCDLQHINEHCKAQLDNKHYLCIESIAGRAKIDPCGTPLLTIWGFDLKPSARTLCLSTRDIVWTCCRRNYQSLHLHGISVNSNQQHQGSWNEAASVFKLTALEFGEICWQPLPLAQYYFGRQIISTL